MKRITLFYGNVYETKSMVDLQNDVDSFLGLVQEEGGKIIEVKICLNNDSDALITVIYEEEEINAPICIMPTGHENK